MSAYLLIGITGYLMGVKHRQLKRHFCLGNCRKIAKRMLRWM